MIIKNEVELINILKKLKLENKKIVTTNGVYDLIHSGHLKTFQDAKSYGDVLFVLVNSDTSVQELKGPKRPIRNEAERAKLILALKPVDYCFIFSDNNVLKLLEIIKPHYHVKGGSYIPHRVAKEKELVESNNGQCIYLPLIGQESTSAIIEKIIDSHKDSII